MEEYKFEVVVSASSFVNACQVLEDRLQSSIFDDFSVVWDLVGINVGASAWYKEEVDNEE